MRTTAKASNSRSIKGSKSKEAHFGLKDDYLDEVVDWEESMDDDLVDVDEEQSISSLNYCISSFKTCLIQCYYGYLWCDISLAALINWFYCSHVYFH